MHTFDFRTFRLFSFRDFHIRNIVFRPSDKLPLTKRGNPSPCITDFGLPRSNSSGKILPFTAKPCYIKRAITLQYPQLISLRCILLPARQTTPMNTRSVIMMAAVLVLLVQLTTARIYRNYQDEDDSLQDQRVELRALLQDVLAEKRASINILRVALIT